MATKLLVDLIWRSRSSLPFIALMSAIAVAMAATGPYSSATTLAFATGMLPYFCAIGPGALLQRREVTALPISSGIVWQVRCAYVLLSGGALPLAAKVATVLLLGNRGTISMHVAVFSSAFDVTYALAFLGLGVVLPKLQLFERVMGRRVLGRLFVWVVLGQYLLVLIVPMIFRHSIPHQMSDLTPGSIAVILAMVMLALVALSNRPAPHGRLPRAAVPVQQPSTPRTWRLPHNRFTGFSRLFVLQALRTAIELPIMISFIVGFDSFSEGAKLASGFRSMFAFPFDTSPHHPGSTGVVLIGIVLTGTSGTTAILQRLRTLRILPMSAFGLARTWAWISLTQCVVAWIVLAGYSTLVTRQLPTTWRLDLLAALWGATCLAHAGRRLGGNGLLGRLLSFAGFMVSVLAVLLSVSPLVPWLVGAIGVAAGVFIVKWTIERVPHAYRFTPKIAANGMEMPQA